MYLKLGRWHRNGHAINDTAVAINKRVLLKEAGFGSEESHSVPSCASSASKSYMF